MPGIIVLTAPRSGSSMIGGMLHKMGVSMGDDLLPGDRINPKGFFEDKEFLNLHAEILGTWSPADPQGTTRWPQSFPRLTGSMSRRYRELLARREARGLWGLKDIRTMLVMDALLEHAAGELRFVVIHRHRDAIARSMGKAFNLGVVPAYRVADFYRQRLLVEIDRLRDRYPLIELVYDDAVERPEQAAARLGEFVGIAPSAAAIQFVDPQLRHHRRK